MLVFKAIVLKNEIDLNKIAKHFRINQKFQWEDLLYINEDCLINILEAPQGKQVYIFSFGAAVFVNFVDQEIIHMVSYINEIEPNINIDKCFEFIDEYKLEINNDKAATFSHDFLRTQELEPFHGEIIATVLAKSVALEKNETYINHLLADAEGIVDLLEQGNLNLSDKKLAKIAASIFRYKINTISYIKLLDKPYITWVNEHAEKLFNQLSALFELDERYSKVRHKSETLMDITKSFSELAHAQRGTRLEWAVILLIGSEILLSLYTAFLQ
ncbi:MAG: hypothetical protein H6Q73_31 [Firmicutes bacterium]|nr:hypothetical protein [Bacillota bacterium]